MKPELRFTSNIELRAAKDKFEIAGIAAAYGVKSAPIGGVFRERIQPGAFSRSLATGADVRALFNHDPNQILGRTKSGTLELRDSPEGLRFTVQLNPKSGLHNDVYQAIKRGDIDSCSFGFTVPDGGDDWGDDDEDRSMKLRTLRRVDLLDVSAVSFPAYPEGTQVSARAFEREAGSVGLYTARMRTWSELQAEAERLARVMNSEILRPYTDEYRRSEVERLGRIIAQEQ